MKNNSNQILIELIKKQRPNVDEDKKLFLQDFQRICKNIDKSIFGDKCCNWNGYITNLNVKNKGTYVNFYFKGKKVALHRILFINYVDNLNNNEYVKYSCKNKGICCNINHLKKFSYNKKKNEENNIEIKKEEKKIETNNSNTKIKVIEKEKIIIIF